MSGMAPLIAVGFASIIANQLLTNNAISNVRESLSSLGVAQGQQLDRLSQAVNAYQTNNRIVLTGGPGNIVLADGLTSCTLSSVCPANTLQPTVSELTNLGYLTGSFSATNYFGGGYTVRLSRLPSGCTYPNCTLEGITALTNPILSAGKPDTWILGSAIETIGANGGFSKTASPTLITGLSGGWNMTNPAGSVAGILGQQLITNPNDAVYYARDGRNALTAPLAAGGQVIRNMASVAAGDSCSQVGDFAKAVTTGAPMYCNSSLVWTAVAGGAAQWANNFASLPTCNLAAKGAIYAVMTPTTGTGIRTYVCDGVSAWNPTAVADNGSMVVPGLLTANKLNVQKVAVAGTACDPLVDGNVAMDATGAALTCQAGSWAKAASGGINAATALLRKVDATSSCSGGYWSCPATLGGTMPLCASGGNGSCTYLNTEFGMCATTVWNASYTCTSYTTSTASCAADEAMTYCSGSMTGSKTCTGASATAWCLK